MSGIERLVEQCITRMYDPGFMVDVIRETYALGIFYEPAQREAATKEYEGLLQEFSRSTDSNFAMLMRREHFRIVRRIQTIGSKFGNRKFTF